MFACRRGRLLIQCWLVLLEPGVPLESWDRRESLVLRDRRALKGNG